MPIRPDELVVGRQVIHKQGARGKIIALDTLFETQAICTVVWDPWDDVGIPYATHIVCRDCSLACRNCYMRQEDHANNGKCLYGPTSWTA